VKSVLALFKIEMAEPAEDFEVARKSNNLVYLRRILILFMILQTVFLVIRCTVLGELLDSEWLFYSACLFLTISLAIMIFVGKEPFFQVTLFLTLFLAAIYSWYGTTINYGEEAFILILLLVGLFIVDAEGFRRVSTITGLIYVINVITNSKSIYIPNGDLILSIAIIVALWIFTEQRHKRELVSYNKRAELDAQHEVLENEIAYRDTLTERLMESEHRFRMFMNHVPVALLVLDDGKITYANKSAVLLTGYDRSELEAIDWIDIIDYEDGLMLETSLSKLDWEPGEVHDYNVRVMNKSRKPIWTRLVITDLKYNFKNIKLISGYDISDQKHYEIQLNHLVRMKEDMLLLTQSILGIDDLGILFDIILDGAIDSLELADRGSILLVGEDGLLRAETYRGYENVLMDDFSIPVEESYLYLKTNGQLRTTEIINDIDRLENASLLKVHKAKLAPIRSTIGTPIYHHDKLYGMLYLDSPISNAFKEDDFVMVDFLRTQLEMAVNKQALKNEAVYLSRYDKLTGVFNRRWFEEYYQTMEMKARRYDDEFALVMFDLNGLKMINDNFGHLEGDALIKGFVDRLKDLTRASDILARFGGDEFVGIFHEISEENLHKRMNAFMSDLVEKPIVTADREIYCRFSYGVAFFQKDSGDYETLVRIADKRMYELKSTQEKTTTKEIDTTKDSSASEN